MAKSKYTIRRVNQRTEGMAQWIEYQASRNGGISFHFFAIELNGKRIDSFMTLRRAREKVKSLSSVTDLTLVVSPR